MSTVIGQWTTVSPRKEKKKIFFCLFACFAVDARSRKGDRKTTLGWTIVGPRIIIPFHDLSAWAGSCVA